MTIPDSRLIHRSALLKTCTTTHKDRRQHRKKTYKSSCKSPIPQAPFFRSPSLALASPLTPFGYMASGISVPTTFAPSRRHRDRIHRCFLHVGELPAGAFSFGSRARDTLHQVGCQHQPNHTPTCSPSTAVCLCLSVVARALTRSV